jgi:hypothetical protein
MRIEMSFGVRGDVRRVLERKAAVEIGRRAKVAAAQARENAISYAGIRTPGTTYSSDVLSGSDLPITIELEAHPRSEGAEINLAVAIGGRKAYQIRPRSKKIMKWYDDGPGGDKYGKHFAKLVNKPAIAGDDFLRRALRNALDRLRSA